MSERASVSVYVNEYECLRVSATESVSEIVGVSGIEYVTVSVSL